MERMKDYYSQIEEAIKVELDLYKESHFYGSLRYALEGGKRIRPVILLLSAESIGRSDTDPLPVAIAVELLHTESVIHDDILDHEIIRRDRPAFHVRYGLGASLLTADFVFGIILNIASRYEDKRIARELSSVALRMCEGEFGELKIDPKIYRLSWDEYINLISQKTASLFEVSAKIGGIVGGGTEDEIEALSNYGHLLGIAYQIQDDIQDWGKEDKVANALKIEQDDKISYLRKMSELYALEAKQKLKPLKDTNAKRHLIDLADFMISRRL
ncbi:MAG: polyprenyl synthetase family protein [archaeon]|nr:polyprenyl synthetase family protein [archaeon]